MENYEESLSFRFNNYGKLMPGVGLRIVCNSQSQSSCPTRIASGPSNISGTLEIIRKAILYRDLIADNLQNLKP